MSPSLIALLVARSAGIARSRHGESSRDENKVEKKQAKKRAAAMVPGVAWRGVASVRTIEECLSWWSARPTERLDSVREGYRDGG
jgi:hypothetical protein